MTTLDTTTAITSTPKLREPVGRRRIIGILTVILGLFILLAFGVGSAAGAHSQFTFTPVNTSSGAPWHLAPLTLLTRWSNIVLGLITILVGVETWVRRPAGALVRFGVGGVLFFIALLLWSCRQPGPAPVSSLNFTSVLIGSLSIAMVLIYGSLSGVLCERAGVVNIAIEGQFIGGALAGAMIDSVTNSFWLAALVGILVGALIGWLLALLAVRYVADQIIIGVVIVTLMGSISSYLNIQVLAPYPNLNVGNNASNVAIPLISKIPIVGPALFNETMFFYAAIVLVALISFGLFRTRWGLRVRSVGEHPKAAESVGISVARVRYSTVILGGAVAGLGGVAFIAVQGQFQPGITSGYGYIALAAMIFGKWKPSGAVVASLLFGVSAYLVDALQNENVPIPTEFMTMFPYLVTIAVVAGLIGRVRPPASDGVPYKRD
ncbi:MAG: ABC transporter permease [Acidimicrobiaceae bacterium]|nr:ABC transporter permease [Acidimicrobiaceae bacterium]